MLLLSREQEHEPPGYQAGRNSVKGDVRKMAIDVEKVQTRLEAKRIELRREIAVMLDEEASLGLSDHEVEDIGEIAQDMQEVLQGDSMILNELHLLDAVEEALRRLGDGTYGLCTDCGQPIPEKRLEAIPWAVRDIACQERCESREHALP